MGELKNSLWLQSSLFMTQSFITWCHTKHDSDKYRQLVRQYTYKDLSELWRLFVSILSRNDFVTKRLSEFREKYPLGRVKTELHNIQVNTNTKVHEKIKL